MRVYKIFTLGGIRSVYSGSSNYIVQSYHPDDGVTVSDFFQKATLISSLSTTFLPTIQIRMHSQFLISRYEGVPLWVITALVLLTLFAGLNIVDWLTTLFKDIPL